MQTPLPDYLSEVLTACSPDQEGELPDDIPELASADPGRLALALATIDGEVYSVGDDEVPFTIQSIAKPFVYALAIQDSGLDTVLQHISVEPSGDAFNELSLEASTGRPFNPMINAGAIAAHSLVIGPGADEGARTERIIDAFSALAGRQLSIDESVLESELENNHRNLGIAHMLRASGLLPDDPAEVVRGYAKQSSIAVTVRDLAVMSAALANGGRLVHSGERVMHSHVARQVLSVMMSCGMYDATGDWVTQVGIPAKSGVAGGIVGALPGQLGIAAFSPPLDPQGNSVRGVDLFQRLSRDMGLHLMDAEQPSHSVIRVIDEVADDAGEAWLVAEVFGAVRFSGGERVARRISGVPGIDEGGPTRVLLDLTAVHSLSEVARRMFVETARRLAHEGHRVLVLDPQGFTADADEPTIGDARVVGSLPWRRDAGA
ncbi:glutaminase [Pseudoclavibacter endophyticus]|uniref:Glutaminase n=1 Tax=Pseudoclavibacter endophyticus TaxID=1778590 RepID=A0A6H9WFA8_9MICO|nr:glutaminase [Pseudoclavibacter endophyticus]KAB1649592.1 glutaminase [Pseudoclavibacter endophyticus]GGA61397.1 glutaminase [Pseudoclavibacter endophyticus]